MTYLYMYRLTSDTGLASYVDNGLLSLECEKGVVRYGHSRLDNKNCYRIL